MNLSVPFCDLMFCTATAHMPILDMLTTEFLAAYMAYLIFNEDLVILRMYFILVYSVSDLATSAQLHRTG